MDLVADQSLFISIKKIQDGDQNALQRLIEQYKPFIMRTTSQFCKRMLAWGHDEELSIGLVAFNSALNTYDLKKETPFLSYCRVVIENRLKDYVRSQAKYHGIVHLDNDHVNNYLEGKVAQEEYLNKTIEDERRQEMEHLEEILSDFSISFPPAEVLHLLLFVDTFTSVVKSVKSSFQTLFLVTVFRL